MSTLYEYKKIASKHMLTENSDIAQEIHYRIYVLEELKMFYEMLPGLATEEDVKKHFSGLMKLITRMGKEFYSSSRDTAVQIKREKARMSLLDVINDFRKRMMERSHITAAEYGNSVRIGINTIIPAWVVYRDSITLIKNDK